MSNEAILAFRKYVKDNPEVCYSDETILVLIEEIIDWRKKYENFDFIEEGKGK